MIPDNCALAVRDGVVCVVGRAGDSRSTRQSAGSAFGFAQDALGIDISEGNPVVATIVTNATAGSSNDGSTPNHSSPEVITNG